MDYKQLAKFMTQEINNYNQIVNGENINDIVQADIRLNAIREVVDKLESGTGIVITRFKKDSLKPQGQPKTYVKECSIEHMDIWGYKHMEKCRLKKAWLK